jgi:alkylation response protein AidB-like acyl-CoA dehydrogenase
VTDVSTAESVRAELDAWVAENWDPEITVGEWWKRLSAAGYASPMLPVELGGKGYSRAFAMAVSQGLAANGCLSAPSGLGLMLAAPTIAAHGSPEQQARFIPRILDGTDAWCQLFSEPGAGSDLAGLNAKAERDGDEYVVTGQKVWTSGGQHADWGMLIARTDLEVPKHQGITYFAIDMHQPGVTVRPLREMTGHALFNEVFLDEARVPADNIIGGLNNGWAVANTTLTVERMTLGSGGGGAGAGAAIPGSVARQLHQPAGRFVGNTTGGGGLRFGGTAVQLAKLAEEHGKLDDPVLRDDLMRLHTLNSLNTYNVARARSGQGLTGVEGNLAKLLSTATIRLAREIGGRILGAGATLWGDDAPTEGGVQELIVFSPGPSIYGGTDQIQRNIVGERGLGLPKEPGSTTKVPFKDLPKNG